MTQLDLPQVSLQRYFDLLKRRRWQVLPVSLLGLLIGGFVALLIPRYYVAEARLTYKSPPAENADLRDPVALVVENAKLTIPEAVGETLGKMGWAEASSLAGVEREAYVRGLRQRIEVVDESGGGRERQFARLLLTYKDQDGQRARRFLDKLLETWEAQQLEQLQQSARAALQIARAEQQSTSAAFESCSNDLKSLDEKLPLAIGATGADTEARRDFDQQLAELERQRQKLLDEQQKLREDLRQRQEEFDRTPRRLEPGDLGVADFSFIQDEKQRERLRLMVLDVEAGRLRLQSLGEFHPSKPIRELEQKQREELLQAELERLGISRGQNPQLVLARHARDESEKLLKANVGGVAELERQLQKLAVQRRQLDTALNERRKLEADLELFGGRRKTAEEHVSTAQQRLGMLQNYDPILTNPAWVPATPTDPNILLVALIGCVIGLGAAIGLILAIDLLQGTYKTVDDVERGLAVPVLGGMSHLETEEQRARVSGSRKRASLLAGSFVVLTVVVVTWYYREPTSLPPFVRDLLGMVLGQG